MTSNTQTSSTTARRVLNKVPEITVFFWVIKVLATTVGETFADYLTETLGMTLTLATVVVGALLCVTLVLQFRASRYVAPVYWLAVVLISVVGTLITDNLVDVVGIPLWVTTVVFAIALGVVALAHVRFGLGSVVSFWIAYILTRPLGASIGDLLSQPTADGGLGLGTTVTSLIFLAAIAGIVGYLSVTKRDVEQVA